MLHPRSQTLSKEMYSKMDTSIKTSLLSWYIAAACRECLSGYKSQNQIYFSTIPHRLWWLFYNNYRKDNQKNPRQLEQSFQKPSWTTNKGIPVHHRKTTENPDWPFRGRTQGKQQLILWPFRGRPQGKQQLTFWSDRGKKFSFYQ